MSSLKSKLGRAKQFLFGSPIKTEHAHQERLPKYLALPVFSSDALSSVAYATEEVMGILMLGVVLGATGSLAQAPSLQYLFPICVCITVLMIIVTISYVQTIYAYPSGGGSFIVTSQNLGSVCGRLAGGSLLIGYTLTVAASIIAGSAAIISAAQGTSLESYANSPLAGIVLSLFFLAIVTWGNLRGMRESGIIFALPTYAFIFGIFALLAVACWKFMILGTAPYPPHNVDVSMLIASSAEPLALFLILRAFSAGCTALTGIEAISDGVPAFRKPESRNAAITLVTMCVITVIMFVGLSWFAQYLNRFNPQFPIVTLPQGHAGIPYQTVVSQVARSTFGPGNWFYYFIQIATMAILVVAANTAFADFPRLSYFMARDGFMPRQLMSLGDRLVYQNGIVTLSLVSGLLIIWSRANIHVLLPLYAVGVFISFTMSQAGMVAWQFKHKVKLWQLRAALSAFGGAITAVVAVVLFVTRFKDGAWIVGVLLIILMLLFKAIHGHYANNLKNLEITRDPDPIPPKLNTVLLLVPRIHMGILRTLRYAQSIGLDVRAIHVNIDPDASPRIRQEWEQYGHGTPLVILESPYRSIREPIIDYVDEELLEHPDKMVTVIVPEFVPRRWWHNLLHDNIALSLRRDLGARRNVVITNVRYFLEK